MSTPAGTTRLGHLLGPHGVQGGVKLYVLGDPAQVADLPRVYVETRGWLRLRKVEGAPPSLVLHLTGVPTREAAEELRGLHVYAADSELPPLGDGTFYYHDLRGLSVLDADGQKLGDVTDVLDAGHQDLLVVDYGGGQSFVPLQAPYVEIVSAGGKPTKIRMGADTPAGLIGPDETEADETAEDALDEARP